MTVWRPSLAALLFTVAICSAQAATSKVTINDLTQRAESGDRKAMHALAESYYAGREGAEQDFVRAADWYRQLAKMGDARAQTSLGLMYAHGYGVTKNLAEAHRWWNFAAIQNDPGAQYNLGLTYATGAGVAMNHERAAHWFREAASRGHVQAQHNLGMLYYEGKGVPKDQKSAYYWVRVAALQDDTIAAGMLSTVSAGMTPEQIAEADAQAAAWVASARKALQ